jgi:hypothetical protein
MSTQSIPTSLAPEVIVDQVGGNLQIKGWEDPVVMVTANPKDLRLEGQEDVIHISCAGYCEIRLPSGASVNINTVNGNAQFRFLEDLLSVGIIHGSLFLRNVADTKIATVHGELMARQVSGDLNIEQVMGNAMLRDIEGEVSLGAVGGNLDLRDVEDEIRVAVAGNARVRLGAMLGSEYSVQAQGNVHCRLPENASLRLSLSSKAESIVVKQIEGSQVYSQPQCEVTLGSGLGKMAISAGGNIFLSAQESGWGEEERESKTSGYPLPEDIGEQIARQVEGQIQSQMESMNRQLQEQMAALTATISKSGYSPDETERIMRQAQERSERAAVQAQENMRRTQEKLERKLEDARRKSEQGAQAAERAARHHHQHTWNFEIPPPPPAQAKEPVGEEERLIILRMLEQKKISLQEAEELLSALEGKEG